MTNAYDDARLAAVYQAGNDMPTASLHAWTRLIGSFAPVPAPAVLEIGAGTGMFCAAMARWLRPATVVGVDPSLPMLAQARRTNPHPCVHYLAGSAEAVPTAADRFDLALMSRVVHHLTDRPRAARQLARVLRPGAALVIRTTFRDRLDALAYDYWPHLRDLDARRFPSRAEVLDDFTAAGFTATTVTSFAQPVTPGLAAYHARLTSRPQSKFAQLTPAQFQEGLQRLAADAGAEPPDHPTPVTERYDLAVLTAP